MHLPTGINFQWLFESAPGLYLVLLPDLTIAAASNTYLQATMTRRKDILGRKLFDVFTDNPNDPTASGVSNLRSSLNTVLQNKKADTMAVQKYAIRRPDGNFEERYWSPLNKPVLNEEGEVVYIIHRVEDVTEFIHLKSEEAWRSKQMEEMEAEIYKRAQEIQSNNQRLQNEIIERKNAEEKFKSLLETAPDAMVIVNDKGEIVIVNKQTENLFGYKRDELTNKPVEMLIPSAYQHKHKEHRSHYFSEPRVRAMGAGTELYAAHKNGNLFPVEISLSPLELNEGLLVSAAIRDITERKKAEEKFKGLLESAPDAMIIANKSGQIVLVNQQTTNMFGYDKDELINQPVEILIPQNTREKHEKHRSEYYKGPKVRAMGTGFELYAVRKDGTQFPVEISLSPLETSEGMLTSAAIRDITERKRTEELLKETEANYSKLFNSIDEGFCIIEMIFDEQKKPVDYRFLIVNASFERQTGLHDAVGKCMREFAPNHEEYWFETYGRIALTGESTRFENRAEQLHRWYEVYAFRFGEPKNLQVAILFNDITKRKETEEQLQKVNKELEAFSYSVSHDLRAPLRIIDGYTKILLADYAQSLDEEGNRLLGIVTSNVRRMGQLIDDLLNLSRLGRKELMFQHLDMYDIANSVLTEQVSANQKQYDIRITELETAEADVSLIRQVWINLISNAMKYSCEKDNPIIEISSFKNGTEIIYSIKDNGVGFNMQYADKLFGVFQRLHKMTEFEGTGVGLALVHRIITRHGGRVWAEAEVGKGATFYFSLPAVAPRLSSSSNIYQNIMI